MILARKIYRIGVQTLYYDEQRDLYYIEIKNRTYYSRHLVKPENVKKWIDEISDEKVIPPTHIKSA